ncbi:MAG: DNA-formamidopyrimidine glycosylase family protein, partial [Bacillota bacterium]
MPELPEVETIRRTLDDLLSDRRIVGAEFRREDILRPDPRSPEGSVDRNVARTPGARVMSLGRLGKNLLLRLDEGWGWVIHLGMSGTLIASGPGEPEEKHTHVILRLEDELALRFRDPRRFGGWRAAETPPIEAVLAERVGIDALDPRLDAGRFARLLGESDSPIKCRLLDQRLVAGLGNIYVDEALFASRIHPA